ncbi:unnamed protein product, partial [Mesorhabditis spiculigera]
MGASESSERSIEREEIRVPNSCFERVERITRNRDGKLLTGLLFESSPAYANECRTAIQHLKRLRHPDILKLLSQKDLREGSFLTEYAEPISEHLKKLGSSQVQNGLFSLANALNFLHESARISHNNICTSSIFIRPNGSFALAGFEYALDINDPVKPRQRLQNEAFLGVQKEEDGSGRDAYLFGQLIKELSQHCELPEGLIELADGLCRKYPEERLSLKEVLVHPALKSDLPLIMDKLINFSLLDEEARVEFVRSLPDRLADLDPTSAGCLLSKPLLSRPVMFCKETHEGLYPRLLLPQDDSNDGILPLTVFQKYTVPEILYIWKVRDIGVRLPLITFLPLYINALQRSDLEKMIIPELHAGVDDVHPEIVASSYEGLAHCVRILGPTTVTGMRPKKIFRDGQLGTQKAVNGWTATATSIIPPEIPTAQNSVFHSPAAASTSAVSSASEEISNEESEEWNEEWGEEEAVDTENTDSTPIAENSYSTPVGTIGPPSRETSTSSHKPIIPVIVDVKEITLRTEEDDFFADMAPKIKTGESLIDKLIREADELEKTSKAEKINTPPEKGIPQTKSALFQLAADNNIEDIEGDVWEAEIAIED